MSKVAVQLIACGAWFAPFAGQLAEMLTAYVLLLSSLPPPPSPPVSVTFIFLYGKQHSYFLHKHSSSLFSFHCLCIVLFVLYFHFRYGEKVTFTSVPQTKEEMGENKSFKVSVDGAVVYNRLNDDGSNRTDTDPNPSTDGNGGKANAGGSWGPIICTDGNDWWGSPTPGKVAMIKAAIDAKL